MMAMRKTPAFRLCLSLAISLALPCILSCAHHQTAPRAADSAKKDVVSFQGGAVNILAGPLNLTGRLKKPEGDGPFPAVVLLHGCGGMQSRRDNRWAERLSAWGYVTLEVDSFRPRGISSVCTYTGSAAIDIVEKRLRDAYDAKRYLSGLPFVDKDRIAVMGWSHGGQITLLTAFYNLERPFQAAVAFYPYCRRYLSGLNAPLLVLIGDADDWTPARLCVEMMPREKTSPEVMLKVYPGAFHGFDFPGANHDVQGSTGMHHLEYNKDAEADAVIRVRDFFGKHLQ